MAPLLLPALLLVVGAAPASAATKPTISLTVAKQLSATVQTGTRVELSAKATHAPSGAQIWIGQLSNRRLSVGKRCANAAKVCKAGKTRTTPGTSSFQAVLVVRTGGKWVTIKRSRAVAVTWTVPPPSATSPPGPPGPGPVPVSGSPSPVYLGGATFMSTVTCSTDVDALTVQSSSNAASGSLATVYLYDYSTGSWIWEGQWHNVSNYTVQIKGAFNVVRHGRFEVWLRYAQYTSSGWVYAGQFPTPYYQRDTSPAALLAGGRTYPSATCYL